MRTCAGTCACRQCGGTGVNEREGEEILVRAAASKERGRAGQPWQLLAVQQAMHKWAVLGGGWSCCLGLGVGWLPWSTVPCLRRPSWSFQVKVTCGVSRSVGSEERQPRERLSGSAGPPSVRALLQSGEGGVVYDRNGLSSSQFFFRKGGPCWLCRCGRGSAVCTTTVWGGARGGRRAFRKTVAFLFCASPGPG